jgi:hypothetical protein
MANKNQQTIAASQEKTSTTSTKKPTEKNSQIIVNHNKKVNKSIDAQVYEIFTKISLLVDPKGWGDCCT